MLIILRLTSATRKTAIYGPFRNDVNPTLYEIGQAALLPPWLEYFSMRFSRSLSFTLLFAFPALHAQAPVVPSADPESLFTSPNPRLNANKQVVLHIIRDLLEASHWEDANKYLTERYIQHNPYVASGLAPVKKFFSAKEATPIPSKMKTPVVAVTADKDLVVVSTAVSFIDPRHPSQCYTSTWFDMWRIVNGKADEHWDEATIAPPGQPPVNQPCPGALSSAK